MLSFIGVFSLLSTGLGIERINVAFSDSLPGFPSRIGRLRYFSAGKNSFLDGRFRVSSDSCLSRPRVSMKQRESL